MNQKKLVVAGLCLSTWLLPAVLGQDPRPVALRPVANDVTAPLRGIPPISPAPDVLKNVLEMPRKLLPNREGSTAAGLPDPVAQTSPGTAGAPSTGTSFDGVNNVNGVLPPDPTGAIGPNHYVQMVNLSFAIYDRNGSLLYGPANNNTLWQGFGAPCATSNDGDPIVLYDRLADRWVMSQFALPNFPFGPFYQCLAVSQTPDPTGSWYRYAYQISSNKMNDYPKLSVWPDGYYMSINQFSQISLSWAGAGAVAFERQKMLAGQPAQGVYFDLYGADRNLGGMLPADLDGPAPPAGTPNYFVQIDDNAWGYSPDQIQLWQFHVDWANPSSSTFTLANKLATASFDANMCGYSRNCVPQPGGTKVDAISDRAMFRLQYRNFGSRQTLLFNHTVDENGNDHAGIRWYELRNTGGGWGIFQQGTYAPNADHRWMGSIAMNGAGNIGLGYSISSTSRFPSVFVTGRLAGDALGQMTQGESAIVNGGGYQSHSSGRWGDYSHLSVDPLDDCTFWYTQEYYANSSSSAGWRTRIGSFRVGACGAVDNPPSVTLVSPAEGATVSGTVTVTANASDDNGVKQVQFFVDGVSIGVDTDGSNGWSVTWNTTTSVDGSHTVTATATDTANKTTSDTNTVNVDNVPDAPAAPSNLTATARTTGRGKNQAYANAVDLSWTDNSNNEESFVVERCDNIIITGNKKSKNYACFSEGSWMPKAIVTVPKYPDTTALANSTYLYRVAAKKGAAISAYSNEAPVSTPAL